MFMLFSGMLTKVSQEAVGKLLRRANKVGSSKKKTDDSYPYPDDSIGMVSQVKFFVQILCCAYVPSS